jgi:hypothetical protein
MTTEIMLSMVRIQVFQLHFNLEKEAKSPNKNVSASIFKTSKKA